MKEIKTEKQALEEPLGTFYHPKKNTYRTGACEVGKILRKGYTKTVKDEEIYIGPVCIKNKEKNGIKISHKSDSKIKENNRMQNYLNKIDISSYKSVILKLYAMLRKKNINNSNKKQIESDIVLLKKWRENNPSIKENSKKYINKNNLLNKDIEQSNVLKKYKLNDNMLFNKSIKEFHNNLNNDFILKIKSKNRLSKNKLSKNKLSKNKLSKNNTIKELSNKDILQLIKNNK